MGDKPLNLNCAGGDFESYNDTKELLELYHEIKMNTDKLRYKIKKIEEKYYLDTGLLSKIISINETLKMIAQVMRQVERDDDITEFVVNFDEKMKTNYGLGFGDSFEVVK